MYIIVGSSKYLSGLTEEAHCCWWLMKCSFRMHISRLPITITILQLLVERIFMLQQHVFNCVTLFLQVVFYWRILLYRQNFKMWILNVRTLWLLVTLLSSGALSTSTKFTLKRSSFPQTISAATSSLGSSFRQLQSPPKLLGGKTWNFLRTLTEGKSKP